MSVHSELFASFGAPLILQNHGDANAVVLQSADGEVIPCSVASLGPIDYLNEIDDTDAGNILQRVARRSITIDVTPPLDATAFIKDEPWAIDEITSSGSLARVSLVRKLASSYGNKQI